MLYLGLLALASQHASTVTCDPADPARCMCDGVPIGPHTWKPEPWLESNKTSIYETSASLMGVDTSLSKFRAKVRGAFS
jgi:hypothetical protein